ncbi:hypothetical protein CS063_14365 [Sporanaerobium hydrogeniformans]|uniref:Uncharacterized protein n=1 Tax=Sporanaerobium hydrogeniformans TaxID=3072179 RepID=A0AC61D9C3_9FIRM|nr:hypothetical protein [Sporanaerobium hydrogeniformans]PHV69678.1 hypothetical protein CS063_14365 [Sporanaerobium hydrogeniformans]
MKNFFIKLLLSITLSLVTIFNPIMTNASSISSLPNVPSAQHKQIIQGFIGELNTLQNRIYNLTQFFGGNEPITSSNYTATIQSINEDLSNLNKKIDSYYKTVPTFSEENREVLLLFNAFNFSKDGLYTLSLLNDTTSTVEKIQLLDRYFQARLSAIDAINLLKDLLSSY